MMEGIKDYKRVNFNNDYNHIVNSNLDLSDTHTMFFYNDSSVISDSGASVIENVDVLTSLFCEDVQDLGATVMDVSSSETVVANNFRK